jgi:hypothetical protein
VTSEGDAEELEVLLERAEELQRELDLLAAEHAGDLLQIRALELRLEGEP